MTPLSDEEAADFALSLSPIERTVIAHFAKGKAWQYQTIADKVGVPYSVVQDIGQRMQREHLGHISVIPYNGCRFFLNDRGESVKNAVVALARIEARRSKPADS